MKIFHYLALFAFLPASVPGKSQSVDLENDLKTFFLDLPVMQSHDSILEYLKNDTVHYMTESDIDSSTQILRRMWIISKDTILSEHSNSAYFPYLKKSIIYLPNTRSKISSSFYIRSSALAASSYTNNNFHAWKKYRKTRRKFKKHFAKRTKSKSNGLMGAKSHSTFYYENKNDEFPLVEIYWHNSFDLMRSSIGIIILDKKSAKKVDKPGGFWE